MDWKYLDLAIVIGYMLLMLGVAFYYYKFARKSLENFFLGGRNVPGWMNGISYAAALVSPDAATGYGGLAIVSVFKQVWFGAVFRRGTVRCFLAQVKSFYKPGIL
ncbi:MAG: hypothetical protein J0H29_12205 [Sphingobacteriales bacterium]|nr:hypothetical protein [Sphingobacteriales bacterium]